MARRSVSGFEHSVEIDAPPGRILRAFFDPDALRVWWQASRSVTTPRTLGVYALEWEPTAFRDDVLGHLGGAFHGTIIEYRAVEGAFFVADCYWLPPEGEPIGPMALDVKCVPEGAVTRLLVAQSGHEDGVRWNRYYAVITPGWKSSLRALKRYLEEGPAAVIEERMAGRSHQP